MNQIKAVLAVIVFVLVMLLAIHNVDVLSTPVSLGLHWPQAVSYTQVFPLYSLIALVFFLGFVLASLFSLREHLARRKALREVRRKIRSLEKELAPAPAEPMPSTTVSIMPADAAHDIPDHLQTETESAMDATTKPIEETPVSQQRKEEEVLVRHSAPGWGLVLLIAAALAVVISGGVYIVLNDRLTQLAAQMDDVSGLTGHLSSSQQEMSRSWEQERVLVREELDDLGQTLGSLNEQFHSLARLPEEVRMRLVAGFLRDAAGRAAFLRTQVDTEEQRKALQDIYERLQDLALELEQ